MGGRDEPDSSENAIEMLLFKVPPPSSSHQLATISFPQLSSLRHPPASLLWVKNKATSGHRRSPQASKRPNKEDAGPRKAWSPCPAPVPLSILSPQTETSFCPFSTCWNLAPSWTPSSESPRQAPPPAVQPGHQLSSLHPLACTDQLQVPGEGPAGDPRPGEAGTINPAETGPPGLPHTSSAPAAPAAPRGSRAPAAPPPPGWRHPAQGLAAPP